MEPRFLADSMLGKLARWLVILGYDARFAGCDGRPDLELLAEARREGRVFLTRDTGIPAVAGLRQIVIAPERFEEQLRLVLDTLGLRPDPKRRFSRCTCCNLPLEAVSKEEARPLVPPKVRELDTPFTRCPGCRRLYWFGSHTERTLKKLERMCLGDPPQSSAKR